MGDDIISTNVVIEETIAGEWWWIAALMEREWHNHLPKIDTVKVPERTRDGFTAIPTHATFGDLGAVTIAGDDAQTTLQIVVPQQFENQWKMLIGTLKSVAEHAHNLRRQSERMTAEGAIEYYYRLRGTPRRKTLGEIAAIARLSESYLRKVKVAYDKAGKWGSKSKKR